MNFFVGLFLFAVVFQSGNAISECPLHGVNSLIYFDLEQLSLIALQQGFNNVIQSPVLCEKGEDAECSRQQCCHGEVGCCYTKSAGRCGCKKPEDDACSYPAPLAIMANSECESEKYRKISTCWRENRGNEQNHILTITKPKQAVGTGAKRNSKQAEYQFLGYILSAAICEASGGFAC